MPQPVYQSVSNKFLVGIQKIQQTNNAQEVNNSIPRTKIASIKIESNTKKSQEKIIEIILANRITSDIIEPYMNSEQTRQTQQTPPQRRKKAGSKTTSNQKTITQSYPINLMENQISLPFKIQKHEFTKHNIQLLHKFQMQQYHFKDNESIPYGWIIYYI